MPVHYDMKTAEKVFTDAFRGANEKLGDGTKYTAGDKEMHRLQEDGFEPALAIHLWVMRRINEGAEPQIVAQAFGAMMGNCLFSAASNICGNTDFKDQASPALFAEIAAQLCSDTMHRLIQYLHGNQGEGATFGDASAPGQRGGRA